MYLVVGSGMLGVIAARRLAEADQDVLVLEAGEARTAPPGSHLRNRPELNADPLKFFNTVLAQADLLDPHVPDEELPGVNVTRARGGQGIVWTNNCPELAPHERWPGRSDEEWEALYAVAGEYLGVTDDLFPGSLRRQFVRPVVDAFYAKCGGDRVSRPLPIAAHVEAGLPAYHGAFDVMEGCDAMERITFRENCPVRRILWSDGRVEGVELESGETLRAEGVVVAAGAVDTPWLLHRSGIQPEGLGRGIHYHPLVMLQVVLDNNLCGDADDPLPRLWGPPTPEHPWHSMILRDIDIWQSPEAVPAHRLLEFQFFVPVDINPENRILFDAEQPRFRFTFSAADRERMRRAEEEAVALAGRLGRIRKESGPTWNMPGFSHLMGTCALQVDDEPALSVTDGDGLVHGFDNLCLATVGLIPRSTAVNPTFTGAALAVAGADALLRA